MRSEAWESSFQRLKVAVSYPFELQAQKLAPKEGLAPSPKRVTTVRATLTLLWNKIGSEGTSRTCIFRLNRTEHYHYATSE